MLLEQMNHPNDIKSIMPEDYKLLAEEIRDFLIEHISVTGGHLASNLGTVELTMALHLSLNLPKDKIIWDVGHQAYTHKLLTGRREGFDMLRKEGGLSGFPKRNESECDCFNTGHSSTSLSAGLGFVKARDIENEDYTVVSVIGDGSLTGGMAYEALNNAARLEKNYIIVLNDNNMSISENVGGVSKYLNNIRTADRYLGLKEGVYKTLSGMPKIGDSVISTIRRAKSSVKQLVVPGMFFEDMGITYLGPVDGHNIPAMLQVFKEAKRCKNAVLVHVLTEKGKGYVPAERHPARFHGTEPFEIETGLPKVSRDKSNWTDVFSTVMCKLGARNEKVVAITAAMPDGTGLKRFHNKFPDRFFDVGIAEEHAVTFAAALSAGGMIPIVAIYSSFLQRAYDQILHDVCMQDLPVVFAIDRAGLVGSDGETHQGVFDLSYLSSIPNMTILAPKNKWELSDMIKYAVDLKRPVAVRYPRGLAYDGLEAFRAPVVTGRSEIIYREDGIALLAVGNMVQTAVQVHDQLAEQGIHSTLVNARFVKPIDTDLIDELVADHSIFVTMEENVISGGYGEKVVLYMNSQGYLGQGRTCLTCAIPDKFIEQGNVKALLNENGLSCEKIVERIQAVAHRKMIDAKLK